MHLVSINAFILQLHLFLINENFINAKKITFLLMQKKKMSLLMHLFYNLHLFLINENFIIYFLLIQKKNLKMKKSVTASHDTISDHRN